MRKTSKLFSLLAVTALALVSKSAWADAAAATPAPTPAAPTIAVGGMVDTYYTYNFTNGTVADGAGNVSGSNANLGSYFNIQDNEFALSMAELKATATQGDASGHLVLSYDQYANLALPNPGLDVLQAYVALAAGQWTFTAGRFATFIGNEVIESNGNWNYSRSELFWATIPLWHQGLSIAFSPSDKIGATLFVLDGWNNTGVVTSPMGFDIGKTYGLQIAIHPDASSSIFLNGIIGPGGTLAPEDPADARYTAELIASLAVSDKFSLALDAEYFGQDTDVPVPPATTGGSLTGWGVDLYGRYQIVSDWAAALRLEEVYDDNGYMGLGGGGMSGEVRDATLTVEHNVTPAMLVRLEGRMDMAVYGGTQLSETTTPPGPYAGGSGTQATATVSSVFSF